MEVGQFVGLEFGREICLVDSIFSREKGQAPGDSGWEDQKRELEAKQDCGSSCRGNGEDWLGQRRRQGGLEDDIDQRNHAIFLQQSRQMFLGFF